MEIEPTGAEQYILTLRPHRGVHITVAIPEAHGLTIEPCQRHHRYPEFCTGWKPQTADTLGLDSLRQSCLFRRSPYTPLHFCFSMVFRVCVSPPVRIVGDLPWGSEMSPGRPRAVQDDRPCSTNSCSHLRLRPHSVLPHAGLSVLSDLPASVTAKPRNLSGNFQLRTLNIRTSWLATASMRTRVTGNIADREKQSGPSKGANKADIQALKPFKT